jgi:hypothetical protein
MQEFPWIDSVESMPPFKGTLTQQIRDVATYVTQRIAKK